MNEIIMVGEWLANAFVALWTAVGTWGIMGIGIIGIALIFAVSRGMTAYIDHIQENTLSSYPLTIESATLDVGSLLETFIGVAEAKEDHENDAIYTKPVIHDMVTMLNSVETTENDLKAFKKYIETERANTESETGLAEAINGVQYTYNLDLQNCAELTLSDVILPNGAEMLQKQVLTQLSERFGSLETSGLYPDYQEVVKDCFDDDGLTSNWYFSENGLVIYFNCYEIAPYAAGIIKVEIPYDMLEGVIKPVYVPENSHCSAGDIKVLDSVGNRKVLGGSAEGEWIFAGTDQTVYDIKLHKLTGWLTDDVPIVGPMILAANRLTDGETIAIPATDDLEYLLNYRNGDGIVRKLVIGTGGIREIVNEIAE